MIFPRTPVALAGLLVVGLDAGAQSLQANFNNLLGIDDVEITPDERYAVVRQNRSEGYVRVYDLATGQLASAPAVGTFSEVCGEVLDAVAVTNTRAIVLGGRRAAILDLTNLANPVIAQPFVGLRPNDVAVTPDGTLAVVRGGNTDANTAGGTFVFRLSDGAQIGFRAGAAPFYDYTNSLPYSFDTDGVAVSDRHAISLSIVQTTPTSPARTRVSIWDLHPGAGDPIVIEETGGPNRGDLRGAPHDVAITPDGLHAVARSEEGLCIWALAGGTATRVFGGGLTDDPGPFLDSAMDSIEVTNDLVVTLANVTHPLIPFPQTQVEVVDWSGARWSGRIAGRPHDLGISPNGRLALVRTSDGVALYRLGSLGAPGPITPIDWIDAPSATNGYLSGLDSVAMSDDSAVTLTNEPNLADTRVWFWSLAREQLELVSTKKLVGTRPTDVVITPDARRVVVSGNSSVSVFHLGTGGRSFETRPTASTAYYQWCDGIAASANRAVGVGQWNDQAGWVSLVDTAPFATRYCTANPNSTGRNASILALGNASVSANSLKLCVDGATRRARGRFVYGTTQTQIPFGDGVQCVGGNVFGLRFLDTNVGGSAFLDVNYASQTMPAGIVLPGSTWNFQFVYVDQASPGFGVNSSDAVSVPFGP